MIYNTDRISSYIVIQAGDLGAIMQYSLYIEYYFEHIYIAKGLTNYKVV